MPRVGEAVSCAGNNMNTLYLWQTAFAHAFCVVYLNTRVSISDAEISLGPVSPKIQIFCLTLIINNESRNISFQRCKFIKTERLRNSNRPL